MTKRQAMTEAPPPCWWVLPGGFRYGAAKRPSFLRK